jgi:deazaflavin-dependent oxidoreductase (nitroreductase family)
MLRLHTIGRRSGQRRSAMIGYYEDGPNLVTLAMNGWGTADPAWWLNLQASPIAVVDLPDGTRAVRAREASGAERDRLWETFRDYPGWGDDLGALATHRPGETAVVVLEPATDGDAATERPGGAGQGHDLTVEHDPASANAAATDSSDRRRLRLRHLWIVPALGIMVYANGKAQELGVGILPLLAFGIAPDLPRLLGLGQPRTRGRMARRAVPTFNLMHHPLPPIALLVLGMVGVVPSALYVGSLAWIGHIVFGLGLGDRLRRGDGSLPPLWPLGRPAGDAAPVGHRPGSTSAEYPA